MYCDDESRAEDPIAVFLTRRTPRRCSLLYKWSFHKGYSRRGRASAGSVLEYLPDEGAMLLEALEVLGFLVRSALLPESPEDLQPAFAQATKSAGMTVARIAFGSIIG